MKSFDDRKNVAEKKFVLTAEQEFKIDARRNKLLGIWVADLIGKSGDDVTPYVLEVIKSDMEEPGDDDVFRKIKQDIIAAGVQLSDVEIRSRMDVLMTEARVQVVGED
ncbi:MAG: hypothetical protein COC03_07845 [Robiginitomaculum sp.]|nr:MAG: hypothetical protein COC03_07845 [Robiginitomaculum sp.]